MKRPNITQFNLVPNFSTFELAKKFKMNLSQNGKDMFGTKYSMLKRPTKRKKFGNNTKFKPWFTHLANKNWLLK